MADLIEKMKSMTPETMVDNLADDVAWTSAMTGQTTNGIDAVKAMMEGMKEKMKDMKPEMSNYVAVDASTVTFDSKFGEHSSSVKVVFNGDGKIQEWTSSKK